MLREYHSAHEEEAPFFMVTNLPYASQQQLKQVRPVSKTAFERDATTILGENAELAALLVSFYDDVTYEAFEAAFKGEAAPEPADGECMYW